MKVYVKPTDFNSKLIESITSYMDLYVAESRILKVQIPKLTKVYEGMFTTALPYTVANWSIRIGVFRSLNRQIEFANLPDNRYVSVLRNFLTGALAGAIGAFLTNPLLKLHIANHRLHSQGGVGSSYNSIYDSIFIENKFTENRNNIINRLRVLYRYSSIITLRGLVQGGLTMGAYHSLVQTELQKDKELEQEKLEKIFASKVSFITSTNPLLEKLIRVGEFDDLYAKGRLMYSSILNTSIFTGMLAGVLMSRFDLAFHYLIKEALANKDKRLNFNKEYKKLKTQKIFGKNLRYLYIANSMRYAALFATWNSLENYLFN